MLREVEDAEIFVVFDGLHLSGRIDCNRDDRRPCKELLRLLRGLKVDSTLERWLGVEMLRRGSSRWEVRFSIIEWNSTAASLLSNEKPVLNSLFTSMF